MTTSLNLSITQYVCWRYPEVLDVKGFVKQMPLTYHIAIYKENIMNLIHNRAISIRICIHIYTNEVQVSHIAIE